MALTAMQVFNSYIMPLVTEMFPQEIAKFNAASNNTIVLSGEGFDGNYLEQSFYQALHDNQRRVDRYAANGAVAPVDLTQGDHVAVKVAGGFGPIRFEPSQMSWLRKPTQEGLTVAARYFTEALLADQLNTAILSLVAAIGNVAALTEDVSGGSTLGQSDVNNMLARFGDASQNIAALIMTGNQYHKLIGEAITNSNSLFEIGGVAVRQGTAFGQGRPIIVTDAPALRIAGVPNKQQILGLVPGAITVHDNNDIITNVDTTNGNERIETTFQADYTFGLRMKGYSWDTANGGASPTDADLGTGTNWDQDADNVKHTAGVLAIGDE